MHKSTLNYKSYELNFIEQKEEKLSRVINIIRRFFIYNNYKNHIINNKSDKNKILNLQMVARQCQWRGANAPLSVASLCKRVTVSGAFA
jgi:hypothetical protein